MVYKWYILPIGWIFLATDLPPYEGNQVFNLTVWLGFFAGQLPTVLRRLCFPPGQAHHRPPVLPAVVVSSCIAFMTYSTPSPNLLPETRDGLALLRETLGETSQAH